MDSFFDEIENDSNNDSKYINSDDEVIIIDSDDDEISKKVADKWFAKISQSQEPMEYNKDKNEIKLQVPSCVVRLDDVLKPERRKKTRTLKKSIRELLKSISSSEASSSSEEEDKEEEIPKKNKLDENRKRLQSLCSPSSSDENQKKKVKISERKTKIIRSSFSSSEENLQIPEPVENIPKSPLSDNETNKAPTTPKSKQIIQKKPTIIEPPHLPVKRGMHRGISIDTSEKMLKRAKISSRRPTLTFGADELAAKHEKEKMVELRKAKLKELAETEAVKKQLKQDEVKGLNHPKIKVTKSNRGAFLTEDTIPKPSSRIVIKNPTRNEVAMLPKIPRIKRKSECEAPNIEEQEELFTIFIPKKSNLKKDSSRIQKTKHVTFNDTPEIKFYQIDEGNILSDQPILKDAPTIRKPEPPSTRNNERKIKDPNKHKVQDVLTQVTEWPPEWFDDKFLTANTSPPVNGINYLLLPMVHEFKTFEDYIK